MRGRAVHLMLAAMLLCAASHAQALVPYTGTTVTVASSTDGAPQDIPATLLKPEGAGPFPAIVIMHDCSGLGARSSGAPGRWGQLLAGAGYVVIIPDSFAPRGFPTGVCTVAASGPALRATLPAARVRDAYAALAFLRKLDYVARDRVGVMGGSHGGSTTLAVMADEADARGPGAEGAYMGFAAGIALYPGCGAAYGAWNVTRQRGFTGPVTGFVGTYKPVAPLLILIGEKDDWTPAAHCEELTSRAQAAGYPVSIKVYPGALHSFDSANPPRYLDERRNANKPDGHGATTGGDPAAWADAIKQVNGFFARYLGGGPPKD